MMQRSMVIGMAYWVTHCSRLRFSPRGDIVNEALVSRSQQLALQNWRMQMHEGASLSKISASSQLGPDSKAPLSKQKLDERSKS